MKTPHRVNYYYAIFLLLIGLFGLIARYMSDGDIQVTSLIPAFFGFILLFFTKGIKNDNALIAHLAVVLTFVLAAVVTYMFVKNLSADYIGTRKFFIFLVTGLVSYIVLGIYLAGFIDKKRKV
ncbi:MAG: hypothetical protein KKG99_07475 [Bacteroidetes bacterium]|nr:hypothetical protein [Bacteroidota bacterium]